MKVTIESFSPAGKIKAISSKSVAHRALICASFAKEATKILCEEVNDDILRTAGVLRALGAKIERRDKFFFVTPISSPNKNATLDCGESGSTLRFMLPIVCALGCGARFVMSGRLPSRPLSPLREELEAHGINFSEAGVSPLCVSGRIECGEYRIRGDVSSQFISGLMFALSLLEGKSTLIIEGALESLPYINLTLDTLADFDSLPEIVGDGFIVDGKGYFTSPSELCVEGDWSNAAFALCAGAMSRKSKVSVTSLDADSAQGDRSIIELLVKFGADVRRKDDCFTVKSSRLSGLDINAVNTPDLVPILAVLACAAEGRTRIYGAARLKLKESDRLESVTQMLRSLGADIEKTDDGLIINGTGRLCGGVVSSFSDHRIAMSAAVASVICDSPVTVLDAQAVDKSYPAFWEDIAALGAKLTIEK